MMTRRELIAGGIAAGAANGADGLRVVQDSEVFNSMLAELREIRRAVSTSGTAAVAQIRDAQRTYFKNSGRFPEFVDVGYNVFQSVIDWMIAFQQPVTINRLSEGRYAVAFIGSTIALRSDYPDNYVGQGYDR